MDTLEQIPVNVAPLRMVTIKLASMVTGYSPRAIESKIQRGDWQENQEWRRAPDGRVLVDLEGYLKWAGVSRMAG